MSDETADEAKASIADAKVIHAGPEFAAQIHSNHPFYLHPSDNPGMSPICIKLSGPESYAMWSRAMLVLLQGMNKLGFVYGSYAKDLFDFGLHAL